MLQGFYCKTEVFIAFIMYYFFRVSQETFKQLNRYKVLAGTKNSRPVGFYSSVIGHGILAGKYLAEYRDSLK
jgi:hypothetical protein